MNGKPVMNRMTVTVAFIAALTMLLIIGLALGAVSYGVALILLGSAVVGAGIDYYVR